MNELLIFRHAKTEPQSLTGRDFDRELKPRGERNARAAGEWLREIGAVPDRVVSSPAARARQTAELACQALGLAAADIHLEADIYEAMPGTLVRIVEQHLVADRLLIVGHNPGFEMLVRALCGQSPIMPTGAVAHLAWPAPVQALADAQANLLALWTPREGPAAIRQ